MRHVNADPLDAELVPVIIQLIIRRLCRRFPGGVLSPDRRLCSEDAWAPSYAQEEPAGTLGDCAGSDVMVSDAIMWVARAPTKRLRLATQ